MQRVLGRVGGVRTAVVALGGNALSRAGEPATITNQFRHTRESMAADRRCSRARAGASCVVHGNGPQVGDSLVRNEVARRVVEPLPLGVLVAETAGWIGYMLQQSLENALAARRVRRDVVDGGHADAGGPVRSGARHADQADRPGADRRARPARLREAGRAVGRDGAGAWRRMTTSPLPLAVVEFPVMRRLLEQNTIVIAAGGGGPPVYDDPLLGLEGVDAVVDKDRVAAVLARQLEAEVLLILTNVEAVYEGWGTAAARPIRRMTVAQADAMIAAGRLRRRRDAAQGRGGRGIRAHGRRPRDHRGPGSRTGRAARARPAPRS